MTTAPLWCQKICLAVEPFFSTVFLSRPGPMIHSGVGGGKVMRRLFTIGSVLTLTLLAAPLASSAEERSDWRQPLPEDVEPPQTIAKRDTASNSDFSAPAAKLLLEQAGYVGIKDLEQINPFVWRATGLKDGAIYSLTVDYSGTVVGIDGP
jgi:hypothetical protein